MYTSLISHAQFNFIFLVNDLIIMKQIFFEEAIIILDGGEREAQGMFPSINQRPFAWPLRNLTEVSK